MHSMIRTLTRGLLAAGLFFVSYGANATLIDATTNNPLAFSWSVTVLGEDNVMHTLTGNGSLTVSGFNSSSLTVTVTLNNTSSIGGQGGERLTHFGFGIDPNATGVTFSDADDGGMIDADLDDLPSLAAIEVCALGGKNCSGGSNGGIFAGGSDTFSLILAGTWGSSVDIAPIGFKYQTGYGSFEFTTSTSTSTSTTTSTSNGTQVPEPGSLALLGAGLLGLGLMGRARRLSAA